MTDLQLDDPHFLPALKPRHWRGRKASLTRKLLADDHEAVPLVAYGWDAPDRTEFLTRAAAKAEGLSRKAVHKAALRNLARRVKKRRWKVDPLPFGDGEVSVAMVEGDEHTAAMVLLPKVLRGAHEALGAEQLVVGIPHRFGAWACDIALAPVVASLAQAQYAEAEEEGREPVTPALLVVQDGELVGIAVSPQEGDGAGAADFERQVAAAISKVFLANALAGHGPERVLPKLRAIAAKHLPASAPPEAAAELVEAFGHLIGRAAEVLLAGEGEGRIQEVLSEEGASEPVVAGILEGIAAVLAEGGKGSGGKRKSGGKRPPQGRTPAGRRRRSAPRSAPRKGRPLVKVRAGLAVGFLLLVGLCVITGVLFGQQEEALRIFARERIVATTPAGEQRELRLFLAEELHGKAAWEAAPRDAQGRRKLLGTEHERYFEVLDGLISTRLVAFEELSDMPRTAESLVGTWERVDRANSFRYAVRLYPDGEYEQVVFAESDSNLRVPIETLRGRWEVEGDTIVWHSGGAPDSNPFIGWTPDDFVIREQDGSLSYFRRLRSQPLDPHFSRSN